MKLAIRIFALTLVAAGATAAMKTPANQFVPSSQSATAKLPPPVCGPHLPLCPTQPGPDNVR